MTPSSSETLDALQGGLVRGESLPARWYSDPEIARLEIERLFRKSWSYVGPVGELREVIERHLRLVVSVRLQGIFGDSEVSGDVNCTFQAGALGNLNVG